MKSTIENTVEKINETIIRQLRCKTGEEFPAQLHGIAFPIQIKDVDLDSAIPAIIDTDGECRYVFSDDSFSFGLYHRLLSKTYSEVKGFGDSNMNVETDDMLMVIWGFSNQLSMNALDFERKIIIPSIPQKAALVSSDFDSYRIANSEFRNSNYLNKPEEFIFSVKYKVQYKFDRICALETNCI
jgi:hypothetical protein